MGVFAKTALAQTFSQTSGIQIGFGLLKPVAKLLAACIVFGLLFATYGLDLSPGFF